MARSPGDLDAHVLFYQPATAPDDWPRTGLWDAAAEISGVRVAGDPDGAKAGLFGCGTSGHALLFAPDGGLLFSGGITGSRGHVGTNAGREAVIAGVRGEMPSPSRTAVFGCSLLAEQRRNAAPRSRR